MHVDMDDTSNDEFPSMVISRGIRVPIVLSKKL